MTHQTLVNVYTVDASGGTGAQVGTGSLIHPQLVLVHPPLSRLLADPSSDETRFRVGVGSSDSDNKVVEVIDTRGVSVHIHDQEPLATLDLAGASAAPIDVLVPVGTKTDTDRLARAMLTHLADFPEASESPESNTAALTEPPDDPNNPICSIFGGTWLCPSG